MKKLITLLVTAALIASLSVAVMASEADCTGTWYVQSIQQENMKMEGAMIGAMGMDISLTLNEDGTGVMDMNGQGTEAAWTPDGELMMGETAMTFELVDGQLVLDSAGVELILSHEPPEVKDYSMAPAVEDPQLSDFDGTWNAAIYRTMGLPLPINLMGTEFALTIQDGAVHFTETDYDTENNYEVIGSVETDFTAQLTEDGSLFVDFAGEEVLPKLSPGCSGIKLTLHEDGMLTGSIPEVDEQMAMLQAMSESAEAENEAAEAADAVDAEEPAEEVVEFSEPAEAGEGDSSGSSGESAGGMEMTAYIVFEKAE